MTRAVYMAVVFLMATTVGQANQDSGVSECPSDINPNNVVALLETKPQMGVLNDAGEENHCSIGGECPSDSSPEHAVSMLQTNLRVHMLKVGGEESSSEAPCGVQSPGKKEPHQLNMLMMKNTSAMLSEFEKMIDAGEVPTFDIISRIKSLIEDTLMPGLEALRNFSAEDTNDLWDAIQLCNDDSKTKEGETEGGRQVPVNQARSLHAACRNLEKTMYNHNWTNADSYCVKLGEFLHDAAQVTLHIPPASTQDAEVQYLEQASDTKLCGHSEARGLVDSCEAKEEELKSKSHDCDKKQESFEANFCTWKAQLEFNCEALDTCYSEAVTAYDRHIAKTQTLMEKWDAETATLQKILCYCSSWLSVKDAGDNRSQHNAAQFEACRAQTHTPVPANYATRPEKVACTSTTFTFVGNFPGTQGWITQEYSNFLEFVQVVSPCLQSGTDSPTTAATPQTVTHVVTASGGKYFIDGVKQAGLTLTRGSTYIFDTSSISPHPFRLSDTNDGTHNAGSALSSGVSINAHDLTFIVPSSAMMPQMIVYYYCQAHATMGGSFTIVEAR